MGTHDKKRASKQGKQASKASNTQEEKSMHDWRWVSEELRSKIIDAKQLAEIRIQPEIKEVQYIKDFKLLTPIAVSNKPTQPLHQTENIRKPPRQQRWPKLLRKKNPKSITPAAQYPLQAAMSLISTPREFRLDTVDFTAKNVSSAMICHKELLLGGAQIVRPSIQLLLQNAPVVWSSNDEQWVVNTAGPRNGFVLLWGGSDCR